MGKDKKHKDKEKNREHKKKRKHKSRSRSRDKSEKKHKHRDRSRERDGKKRKKDKERDVEYEGYGHDGYSADAAYAAAQTTQIPGLGDLPPAESYSQDGDKDHRDDRGRDRDRERDRDRDRDRDRSDRYREYEQERYSQEKVKDDPEVDDKYGVKEQLQKFAANYYEDGEIDSELKEEPGMERVPPTGYEDPPMDTDQPSRSGGSAPSRSGGSAPSRSGGSAPSRSGGSGGGNEVSLSIQETNKLRAKLGLKPLDLPSSGSKDDEEKKKKEDVHVPAVNMRDVRKKDEIRAKLLAAKEKRKINQMLGKVKTLGDESDEDGALAWVKKSRKLEKEKKIAEKRAKVLDEMDNEFGITNLVDEEFGVKETNPEYTAKDLRGLTVKHDQAVFKEGRTVILTLEDKGVLEEGDEEVLMNINLADDERASLNIENKKAKPEYNPYEEQFDEYGMPKVKDILSKYDDDIDGKKSKEKSFRLEGGGRYLADHERVMHQMAHDIHEQKQNLVLPVPVMASEYYTEAEMTSFNRVKKKVRKVRKKPKLIRADDLMPLDEEGMSNMGRRGGRSTSAPIDPDLQDRIDKSDTIPGLDFVSDRAVRSQDNPLEDDDDVQGPLEDLTGVVVDDEAGMELHNALEKARKLKQNAKKSVGERKVIEHLAKLPKKEEMDSDSDNEDKLTLNTSLAEGIKANITLNQTSEFCRALGEIPTYGQAGNRMEDEDELMDFERELAEERRRKEEEENADNPGWKEVEIDMAPVDIAKEDQSVLEEEPVVAEGMAAALALAQKKGYLVKETIKSATGQRHKDMEAKNYSIEDKRYEDLDEKYRKRERYQGGIISEFKEKPGYIPNVKLDYVDEMGRDMSAKEAFRYLSHRFHGKGSGKMKQEKRKKKRDEEELMKSMSSTDTPLGTATMLEAKLAREKTPYLVLSGGNKALTGAQDHIAK